MNDNDTDISVGDLASADVAEVAPTMGHEAPTVEPPTAETPKDETPPQGKRKGKRERKREVSEAQERAANIPPEQLGLGLFLPDVAQAPEEAQAVFAMVPLDDVEEDAENARILTDSEEDKRLLESIAHAGLEDEIKLIPKPPEEVTAEKPAKYRIKDGHRRFAAYRRLRDLAKGQGFTSIPALIRRDQSAGAVRVGAAVLNLNRRSLRPFEQARALKQMLDQNPGMTVATAAMHADMTESMAHARLRFFDLPEPLARILGDGEHDLGCLDVARSFVTAELRDTHTELYDRVYGIVEDAAKEKVEYAGGRVAHRNAEQLTREILHRIQQELQAVDVNHWEFRDIREEPEWVKAVEELPTLTHKTPWGHEVRLVLEPAGLAAAQEAIEARLSAEEEKRVQEEAKLPPETRQVNEEERKKRAEALFDAEASRHTLEVRRAALKKALAPVTALEPKVEKTLLLLVARHVTYQDDAADAIADICGLDVSEVLRAKQDMSAFLEKLRKKNREVFWRFVAATTAFYLHDPETPYGTGSRQPAVYQLWTGSTLKEAREAAEKELREAKALRAQGKLKAPKATEDARIVECDTCALPSSGKGGVKGKFCVGDSGHRRRTFHASRLQKWAALTGKNPVQGVVRVMPRSGARAKAAKKAARAPTPKTAPNAAAKKKRR